MININHVLRFDTPKYDTSQEKLAFIECVIKMENIRLFELFAKALDYDLSIN